MKKECCETCGYNKFDDGEFICGCEESDGYGCATGFDDGCNYWIDKMED